MAYTEVEAEESKSVSWLPWKTVIDPELGIDIVNLGLVYEVEFDAETGNTVIKMTLKTMGCPLADVLTESIHEDIKRYSRSQKSRGKISLVSRLDDR